MNPPLTSPRSRFLDVIHGSLGFALVSLAAFSIWGFAGGVFRQFGGELGMYSAIAAVFLGLSGVVLGPIAGGIGRFYKAFLPAFLLYAVLWCLAWFFWKNKTGEWVASLAGSVGFTVVSLLILGGLRGWLVATVVFFVLHSAGYFAGDWAMHSYWLGSETFKTLAKPEKLQVLLYAKLSWGLFYGLGFGAGIGWVFHQRTRVGA